MTTFPDGSLPASPHITAFSPEAMGTANYLSSGNNFFATNTWPAANTAIFVPFVVRSAIEVKALFALNGNAVSGNMDIGLYAVDGTRLVSTGSTAQSGTNVIQSSTVSLTIGPGQYYLALALNNTTGRIAGINAAAAINVKMIGIYTMTSAFPLPATAVYASSSSHLIPVFGLSRVLTV